MYREKRKYYMATLLVVFAKLISAVLREFCKLLVDPEIKLTNTLVAIF